MPEKHPSGDGAPPDPTDATPAEVGCSGEFGAPHLVFDGDGTASMLSVALTGDQLELFYVREGTQIRASSRATRDAMFPIGTPVAELDALCAPTDRRSIDVSHDGARAYVVCDDGSGGPFPLRVAERAAPGTPFVDLGSLGVSGSNPAVDGSELALFSTAGSPSVATRATPADDFPAPAPISELAGQGLSSVSISDDGLAMFAGVLPATMIKIFTRSTIEEPFAFTAEAPRPGNVGSPEISADCRSLYAVALLEDVYRLYVVER